MNALAVATRSRPNAAPEKLSYAELAAQLQTSLRQTFAICGWDDGRVLHEAESFGFGADWRAALAPQSSAREEPCVIRFGPAFACLLIPLQPVGHAHAVAIGAFRTASRPDPGELPAIAQRLAISQVELATWHEQQPVFSCDALDCLGRLAHQQLASAWRIAQLDFQAEQLSFRIGERLKDIELLHQIVASLRNSADPEVLARIVLEWAIHSLSAEQAIAQLFEPGADERTKESRFVRAGRAPMDDEAFDDLLAHLQPDLSGNPLILNVDKTQTDDWPYPGVRELIVVPIRSDRRLTGWLAVINHAHHGWFGTHQAQLLHTAAGIMGMRAVLHEMQVLRQASDETNSIKSRLLANVSHELRTPLNGILTFSQVLLDGSLRNETECREGLETIEQCGKRLAEVVDDLLEMQEMDNRRITVKQIDCHVEDIVQGVVSKLTQRAEKKGLALATDGLKSIRGSIRSDPQRLNQILTLLVGNAIKFTESGGVCVSARVVDGDERRLQIAVHDSGIGIPSHLLETIFDPFTQVDASSTRARDGLGLGLAICRRLAQSLGGCLTARSHPDGGSTFTFELGLGPPTLGSMGAADED